MHLEERETTANQVPDVPQKIRARFKPQNAGSGGPPFTRIETEHTSPEYRIEFQRQTAAQTAAAEKDLLDRQPRYGEGWQGRDREGYRGGPPSRHGEGRHRREESMSHGNSGERPQEGPSWRGGHDRGNDDRRSHSRQNDGGGNEDRHKTFNHGVGRNDEDNSRRRSESDHHYGPSTGSHHGNDSARNRSNDYYGPHGQRDRNHFESNRGPPPPPPRRGSYREQPKWQEPDQHIDYSRNQRGPATGRKRGYDEFLYQQPEQTDTRARGYSLEPGGNRSKVNH